MGSNLRHDASLARHVGDEFPRLVDLVAAAEAAQAMLASEGWGVLTRLLEREIATIDRELDGRLLDSRAAYARTHGRLGGLRAAPALLEALIDKAESKVDDERRRHESVGETALERV